MIGRNDVKSEDQMILYQGEKLLFRFDHPGYLSAKLSIDAMFTPEWVKHLNMQANDELNLAHTFPIGLEASTREKLIKWLEVCKYVKITDPDLDYIFRLFQQKLWKPSIPKSWYFRTYGKVKSWVFRTYGKVIAIDFFPFLFCVFMVCMMIGFGFFLGFLTFGVK